MGKGEGYFENALFICCYFFQLHVQIKKENNDLRDEITRLRQRLKKLDPKAPLGAKENVVA